MKLTTAKSLEGAIIQRRIGIQGYPKTGKTVAALTFPNPVFLDFDNNISPASVQYAKKKLADVHRIPFFDPTFCNEICPVKTNEPPNRRDALTRWFKKEKNNITDDITLILDSWTMLQAAFDEQTNREPSYTDKGKEDKFVFWRRKIEYSAEVMQILKSLPCNVIVIFHELQEKDDEGRNTGKLKPLQQGQFVEQIPGHFTDFFRQHAMPIYEKEGDTKSKVIGTSYMWQTQPDKVANCGSTLFNPPMLIDANYESYMKYLNNNLAE